MDLLAQLMMGIGLAACAGLRAWLPMLLVSLMARSGYVTVSPSFEFLGRDDALFILGLATLIELLGDKLLGVDHLLDGLGTIVRPAVGAVLASAMLVNLDPLAAAVLGAIAGGSSSLLVHSGKAVVRVKTTASVPLHGGSGNVVLSAAEDVTSGLGTWMVLSHPGIAFGVVLVAVVGSSWVLFAAVRGIVRWMGAFRRPVEIRT